MKKEDRVTLQRERLYKEVWQTPILQLAKKYGMSDVGLAKVCKRMDIPLPPRGYWAKQAYGHGVDKKPLPPAKKKTAKTTTINKSEEELLHLARNRFSGSKVRHRDRQRIHRLQKELKDWEMSERIRAYITAMRKAGRKVSADNAEFFEWAARYADHLDPRVDFKIEVLNPMRTAKLQ
jgi:hypothetical protein